MVNAAVLLLLLVVAVVVIEPRASRNGLLVLLDFPLDVSCHHALTASRMVRPLMLMMFQIEVDDVMLAFWYLGK